MGRGKALFDLWQNRYKSYRYTNKHTYKDYLLRDYKIREFINNEGRKSRLDIADIIISGNSSLKIDLHTSKPGMVLGKSGANLSSLRAHIAKIAEISVESININLVPVNKPELNASLIALRVAQDLERRRSYNHSMRSHADDAMRFGALGIKVQCSGRLNGVEIARDASVSKGKLSRLTQRANVFYASVPAHTTSGECGVKVWINLPTNYGKKRTDKSPFSKPTHGKYGSEKGEGA